MFFLRPALTQRYSINFIRHLKICNFCPTSTTFALRQTIRLLNYEYQMEYKEIHTLALITFFGYAGDNR